MPKNMFEVLESTNKQVFNSKSKNDVINTPVEEL